MFNPPLAYFITFRAYGTWLHGDERGAVDRVNNQFDSPMIAPNEKQERIERAELRNDPVQFGEAHRCIIERTIAEVCEHRGWRL